MNRDQPLRSHPPTSHCYLQTLSLAVSLAFFAAPAWCQHPNVALLMLKLVETKARSGEGAIAEVGKEPQLNRLVASLMENQETDSTPPRLNAQLSTTQPVVQESQPSDLTTSQSIPLSPPAPNPTPKPQTLPLPFLLTLTQH
ncbi:MAG: hypothetical protein RBJ76_19195 [Stenomitos frigidus ULC029]